MPGVDSEAWIEAWLLADRGTQAECDGWILAVIRHRAWRLGDHEEDLLQDVRLKLVESFERGAFRGDSSLKTFVQAVAKHTCLNAIRAARIRQTSPFSEELHPSLRDHPGEELERSEQARICYEVVHRLPERCRDLLRLVLIDELSYDEIGRRLDIATGTVKSRLSRCRDRAVSLRRSLVGGRIPRTREQGA
jgi:RNA polymerase sigma-70 factor (ECF subfamily)